MYVNNVYRSSSFFHLYPSVVIIIMIHFLLTCTLVQIPKKKQEKKCEVLWVSLTSSPGLKRAFQAQMWHAQMDEEFSFMSSAFTCLFATQQLPLPLHTRWNSLPQNFYRTLQRSLNIHNPWLYYEIFNSTKKENLHLHVCRSRCCSGNNNLRLDCYTSISSHASRVKSGKSTLCYMYTSP